MKIQSLYLISLLLYISKGFSQDIIVKPDSSKIEAKILEVRASEIQYKLFNFQEGPLYYISKNDIAYVVFANGIKEIFETPKIIDTNPVPPLFLSSGATWVVTFVYESFITPPNSRLNFM